MNRTDKTIEWLKNNRILSVIAVFAIIIAGFAATLKNVRDIEDFFGFNTKDSTGKPLVKDTIYHTIPLSEIEGIITNLLKEKPQFYGYQNIYGQNYILSFTERNKRFTLFKEFDRLWEEVKSIDTLYNDASTNDFDEWTFTTIDSLPSLFYTIPSYGNEFGTISFNLLTFKKDFSYKLYSIDVGGSYSHNDSLGIGTFDNSDYSIDRNDLAKQNDNFSKFLEKKIKELNVVEPLTKEDMDLDNPNNAVKAWEILNADWIKQIRDNNDSTLFKLANVQVKFKLYKDNLTSSIDSSSEPDDENENFKLYNYFKYASIIQDKKSGFYFVAIGYTGWNAQKIKLQNDNLYVSGTWYFNCPFLINLRTGNLTLLPKTE